MWKLVVLILSAAHAQVEQATFKSSADRLNLTTTTPAAIIRQLDTSSPDGSYNSSYETSNGIKVENSGYLKRITVPQSEDENEHEEIVLVQIGSYSYFDPEGNLIYVSYLADENGFQPIGDHLPTVPPPEQYSSDQLSRSQQQLRPLQQSRGFTQDRPIQPNPGFTQDRPIQPNPGFTQERPIQPNPGFTQNRPIQPNPGFIQDRPIQQKPGFTQERPIQPNPGFTQNRPIQPNPGFTQDRPIQQNPGFTQDRPIQPNSGFTQNSQK